MSRKLMVVAALAVMGVALVPALPAAAKFNKKVDVGQMAPEWKGLKGTDDKMHSLDDLKKAKLVVVLFTCNHCPVAVGYEDRFIGLARKYKDKGLEVVAISCSNEDADGFEAMKERAKEKEFPFPYLRDEDQSVGRSFGATSTPQLFLLDGERKIAYMGAFDDNMFEDEVKHHYLVDAVEAMLAGKKPEVTETRARGCGINYEK